MIECHEIPFDDLVEGNLLDEEADVHLDHFLQCSHCAARYARKLRQNGIANIRVDRVRDRREWRLSEQAVSKKKKLNRKKGRYGTW